MTKHMKPFLICTIIFLLQFDRLSGLELPEVLDRTFDYTVQEDVSYCESELAAQKLDIYLPKELEKLPIIMIIHGGGWSGRDKNLSQFKEMAETYVKRGFAVFNINYRLSGEAPAPAALHDVNCAARYITENSKKYSLDLERFFVTGNSAGCHLALMLALCNSDVCRGSQGIKDLKIRGVVNRFGITDAFERTFVGKGRKSAKKWFSNTEMDPRELAKILSPVNYVGEKGLPPVITIHGDADTNTPLTQAIRLHEGLIASGNESELLVVKGGNHGLHNISKDQEAEIERAIFSFLIAQKAFEPSGF